MLGNNFDGENTEKKTENQDIDFSNFFEIIKQHFWLIAITFAIFVAATGYNSHTTHPVYEASTTVMVDQSQVSAADQLFSSSSRRASRQAVTLNNQIAYLESRSMAEQVVRELAKKEFADSSYLFGTAEPIEPNFFKKTSRLPAKIMSDIFDSSGKQQGQTEGQQGSGSQVPSQAGENPEIIRKVKSDVSSLNVRSEPNTNSNVVDALPEGSMAEIISRRGQWYQIRTDEWNVGWAHSAFVTVDTTNIGLTPSVRSKSLSHQEIFEISGRLMNWLTIESSRDNDIITINVEAPDAQESALLANTFAEVYYNQSLHEARGEMSQQKEFLKSQLDQVKQTLQRAEQELSQYQEEEEAVALDQSTNALVERVSQFQSELDNALIEKDATEDRIEYLRGRLGEQEKRALDTLTTVNPPYVQSLQDTLAQAQLRLTMLQTNPDIGQNHPALKSVRNRINKIKAELQNKTQQMISQGLESMDPVTSSTDIVRQILEEQGQIVFLDMRIQSLQQLLSRYNEQLEQLPQKSLELARLQRDQQINEELFMLLRTRYEEARIAESGQGGNIQILDPAIVPSSPVRPNMKTDILIGGFLGLVLGIGMAFVLEFSDNTIRSARDVERYDTRIMGSVPQLKSSKMNPSYLVSDDSRLIVNASENGPYTEAYRMIRTNLMYSTADKQLQSLLVTSPAPKEGKSTTVANIALTMAKMGKKVLLIDTDLRRPHLHEMFQIKRQPGITEFLIHENSLNEVVRSTPIENLDIITCGTLPPNASELLGSNRMKDFIREVSEHFDRILFDSSPILAVADASVLSTHTDGTLLVVKAGETTRDALGKSAQQIREVGGSLVGIIVNAMKSPDSGKYGGYYYDYAQKPDANGKASQGKKWEKFNS